MPDEPGSSSPAFLNSGTTLLMQSARLLSQCLKYSVHAAVVLSSSMRQQKPLHLMSAVLRTFAQPCPQLSRAPMQRGSKLDCHWGCSGTSTLPSPKPASECFLCFLYRLTPYHPPALAPGTCDRNQIPDVLRTLQIRYTCTLASCTRFRLFCNTVTLQPPSLYEGESKQN